MGERSEERKEQYKRIRNEFEDLQIEDKALFLLEAMVSTVARGVEQAGKGLADEIDKAFRRASRKEEEAEAEGEAAAESKDTPKGDAGAPTPDVSPEKKAKPPKPSGNGDATTP